jgi:hypothetical protein
MEVAEHLDLQPVESFGTSANHFGARSREGELGIDVTHQPAPRVVSP